MFGNVYENRRVLVTGHTGFKGSWLVAWLRILGAEVAGLALEPPSVPSHFEAAGMAGCLRDFRVDVRDMPGVLDAVAEWEPEIVFHLAAQAIVRRSFDDPTTTFQTNIGGTLHVLEAIRRVPSVSVGVIITSDKCYENVEWVWGYRETDRLGGADPYSASKACAEIVSQSYMRTLMGQGKCCATARAGNVIGGGDWAADRLVPDCMRGWSRGEQVEIRSPNATRPWQHVLEPLSGYLWIAARLFRRDDKVVGASYNLGPPANSDHSVQELIEKLAGHWDGARWRVSVGKSVPEAGLLKLSCDRARADLGWRAALDFPETVAMTTEWYRHYYLADTTDILGKTHEQIRTYCELARQRELEWSTENRPQ